MPNVYRATKRTGVQPSGIKDITNDPITTNGDHTIQDLENYEGVKINVNVGVAPNLQQKTVTAGVQAETFQPDSGYDGMSEVTVNPTPSQSKTVTAGTTQTTVTPDNDKLLSSVVVNPTPSISITPSNSTPVILAEDTIYKTTAAGIAVDSVTSVTPPSSGYTRLSSGSIYKMGGTGYLYGSVQSGGLTKETLWTNSSPSSSFSAQTVNLNSGKYISNYTYIEITFRISTSSSTEFSVLMSRSEFSGSAGTGNNNYRLAGACTGGTGVAHSRGAWYNSNTAVSIGAGINDTSGGTNNAILIPVKISGLK